jgi:hypothetical protein
MASTIPVFSKQETEMLYKQYLKGKSIPKIAEERNCHHITKWRI